MNARPTPTKKPSRAKPGNGRAASPRAKNTARRRAKSVVFSYPESPLPPGANTAMPRLTMTAKQRKAAIAMLRSMRNVSEEEDRENQKSLLELMKAMNESRKGYRVPFPDLVEE